MDCHILIARTKSTLFDIIKSRLKLLSCSVYTAYVFEKNKNKLSLKVHGHEHTVVSFHLYLMLEMCAIPKKVRASRKKENRMLKREQKYNASNR